VPVLLATMAPRMLTMASQQTDSTALRMTGAATIRYYVVPAISAAAGRRRPAQPAHRIRPAGLHDRISPANRLNDPSQQMSSDCTGCARQN
jgi:DNA topoisomerase IB